MSTIVRLRNVVQCSSGPFRIGECRPADAPVYPLGVQYRYEGAGLHTGAVAMPGDQAPGMDGGVSRPVARAEAIRRAMDG
ncbi:MAG: hypothetical protein EBV45_15535, partial [Chloroflexi bacterium]|nr:hypothetical protein [Chloroflexota bacterium]